MCIVRYRNFVSDRFSEFLTRAKKFFVFFMPLFCLSLFLDENGMSTGCQTTFSEKHLVSKLPVLSMGFLLGSCQISFHFHCSLVPVYWMSINRFE